MRVRRRRAGQRAARQPAVRPRRAGTAAGARRASALGRRRPASSRCSCRRAAPLPAAPARRRRARRPRARAAGRRGVAAPTPSTCVDRGRVVAIDYASDTAAMAARPWREWLRTYRGHERGEHPLRAPGTQDITVRGAPSTSWPRCGRPTPCAPRPSSSPSTASTTWWPRAGGCGPSGPQSATSPPCGPAAGSARPRRSPTRRASGVSPVARVEPRPTTAWPRRLSDQGVVSMAEPTSAAIEDYLRRGPHLPAAGRLRGRRPRHRHRAVRRGERRLRGVLGPPGGRPGRAGRRTGTRCCEWELPFAKWFVGGELNVSYNCLDRHVEARPRRQGGVPLGGRAGRHPHHHLRRPARRGAALRQRPEGPRRARRATGSTSTCR